MSLSNFERIKIAYVNHDKNEMKEIFSNIQLNFPIEKFRKEVFDFFVESNMKEIRNLLLSHIENQKLAELHEDLQKIRNQISISLIFDLSNRISKAIEQKDNDYSFKSLIKTALEHNLPIDFSYLQSTMPEEFSKIKHPKMKFVIV